jgi:hypothetical protein
MNSAGCLITFFCKLKLYLTIKDLYDEHFPSESEPEVTTPAPDEAIENDLAETVKENSNSCSEKEPKKEEELE